MLNFEGEGSPTLFLLHNFSEVEKASVSELTYAHIGKMWYAKPFYVRTSKDIAHQRCFFSVTSVKEKRLRWAKVEPAGIEPASNKET